MLTLGMCYRGIVVAQLVSFATNLDRPDISQMRVAEVGLESDYYRSMFCDGSEQFVLAGTQRQSIVCP